MSNKTGLMEIAFTNGVVVANAKTGMIDLKTLEVVGNLYNGVTNETENGYKRLRKYLENSTTQEFIRVCEEKSSKHEFGRFNSVLERCGRGRNSKTFASIHIAIDFAMWLNPEFKYEVIDTFVKKRILDFRLLGIDKHKDLNLLLDTLDDRVGKDNKGIYINTAKLINEKAKGEFGCGWDNKEDSPEIQQRRDQIQKELSMLIKKGYVTSWGDVKEFFSKE